MQSKILFILKSRDNYTEFISDSNYKTNKFSSGLYNSARFVADLLNKTGFETKLVQVNDNNDIDKEVFQFKPTHVIIEALWVVPEKFDILQKLHPTVKWIIRIHSEIPFLANDSIAMKWIYAYIKYKNVYVSPNSEKTYNDFINLLDEDEEKNKIIYLPNYYPVDNIIVNKKYSHHSNIINIGCFDAIRPLKNQLTQAVAAIIYGNKSGKTVYFHINGTRSEQNGQQNLQNIRDLFKNSRHQLVEHSWQDHHDFLDLIQSMDLSMNVSFTETFNIVAADSAICNVPIVCSTEIGWASMLCKVETTNINAIVNKMFLLSNRLVRKYITARNIVNLYKFSNKTKNIWINYFDNF